jgi:DNA-binding GntR family transcriptional regulator
MKQKRFEASRAAPSRLQSELLTGILEVIRTDSLAPGSRLAEVALAERLHVSRTPVRAALRLLARRGLVRPGERRGYFVADRTPTGHKVAKRPTVTDLDRLFLAIARDRRSGKLPDDVSERDLMQRYGATRPIVQRVLTKLSEVAAVQRKPGHGWRFQPTISDPQARAESYRYRILIEPAGLLEPNFRCDPAWIAEMRRRHEEMMAVPWRDTASIAFYEMNAAFHEGLAAASGNRYFLVAVQQQNRLRRFGNYDWTYGYERVVVNCREHLEMLRQIEAGDRVAAAELMRRHLEAASKLKRPTVDPVA